jgi:hypothetical protein
MAFRKIVKSRDSLNAENLSIARKKTALENMVIKLTVI